jgi:OmpA-OmpF porin, OOP family
MMPGYSSQAQALRHVATRLGPALILLGALLANPAAHPAPPERFDVQLFRPYGGALDLARVAQSRPVAHGSLVGSMFLHHMLDPLVLVPVGGTDKSHNLVGSRLQLDLLATAGLWDQAELALVVPVVVAQSGDNLEVIGTEGPVRPTLLGDIRLQGKLAVPGLRRTPGESGLGAALTLGVGLPTGSVADFAGEGAVTSQAGLVLDWRFDSGALLSLNTGVWLKPDRYLLTSRQGSMVTLGLAAEVPATPSRHVTLMGMLTAATPLEGFSLTATGCKRPTEAMLGVRWYGPQGLTYTLGAGPGASCAPTVPAFRTFLSVAWVPPGMPEREALEQTLSGMPRAPTPPMPEIPLYAQPVDEDHDFILIPGDKCPQVPGPVENHGCPDQDTDNDGVVDRLDDCPRHAQSPRGERGCPLARLEGGQLLLSRPLRFASGQPIFHPDTEPVLEEVAALLLAHPEVREVEVVGWAHAAEERPLALAEQRAEQVRRWLLLSSITFERLCTDVQVEPQPQPVASGQVEFRILEGARHCPGYREPALAQPSAPSLTPQEYRQRQAARLQVYAQWAERLRTQPPPTLLKDSPERQQALAALAEATLAWAQEHKEDPLLLARSPEQVALFLLSRQTLLSLALAPAPAKQQEVVSLIPFFQNHPGLAFTLELSVSLIPFAGDLDDAESALVGLSYTGRPLSTGERWMYAAGALLPFVGGAVLTKTGKALERQGLLAGRSVQEVRVLARVAEHLSPEDLRAIEKVLERVGETGELAMEEVQLLEQIAQKLREPLAEAMKAVQAGEKVPLLGARTLLNGTRMEVGSAVHRAQCWVEYQFRYLERLRTFRFQEDLEWRRMYEQILRNKPLGLGFELEILKLARYEKNLALMMPPPGKGLTGFIPDAVKGNPAELVWGLPYHFVEVKAWKDLSNTGNLRAMIEYVTEHGGHIELWVRSTKHADGPTQLSRPLEDTMKTLKSLGLASIRYFP